MATANPLRMGLNLWSLQPAPTWGLNLHRKSCQLHPLGTFPLDSRSLVQHGRRISSSVKRSIVRASNVDSQELQMEIEALRKMRVGAIKAELDALGVSYKDCFEKDELVKRLATMKNRKQPVTRKPDKDKAIVRIPMRKLKSTMSSPKEYIIIPLTFGNRGTFDFLLDTGSSTTIVSPSLAHNKLGIIPGSGQISQGLGGMGDGGLDMREVSLPAVTIAGHLCQPIKGIVMDLASAGLPPSVAGIVGLNILSQFDVEFHFLKEQIAFYAVGAANRGDCDMQGLQKLALAPIQYSLPGLQVQMGRGKSQLAIIDLGSSLSVTTPSVANSAGATLEKLGISGVGVGGQQMAFAKAFIDVTMHTQERSGSSTPLLFEKVLFAVGNLPALQAISCDIILGLNVFSKTRFVLSTATRTAYLQTFL